MNYQHCLLRNVWSFILIIFLSCASPKDRATEELSSLDLIKGDFTFCGPEILGEVRFTQYCSPAVKADFELGISLLHSFEYEEAEKAFSKVLDSDPTCVMAYWGVAMSNLHPLWAPPNPKELEKGSKVLAVASRLPQSKLEKQYINAINAFYEGWHTTDHRTRIRRMEDKMKFLYESNPDDTEAAIFYALILNASVDPADKTYQRQRKAGSILEHIFPQQPNHPGIAHYIIHNYDYPELASRALLTARRYASIAPASAHAQHMPSHIFTRLGLWNECIASNLRSVSASQCYAQSTGKEGHWDEELHGMDYLVYAYLQIGDTLHANEQLEYLNAIKQTFPENFKVAYAAAAIPTRIAIENKNWAQALDLQLPLFNFPWEKFPWQKSIIYFGKALGASHLRKRTEAMQLLDSLRAFNKRLSAQHDTYEANQVAIQVKVVEAWNELAFGEKLKSIDLMKEAAEMESKTEKHPVTPCEIIPAVELLGDLYFELQDYENALAAYKVDLEGHPNRLNGLYGAWMAAKKLNDIPLSRTYFEQLNEVTSARMDGLHQQK